MKELIISLAITNLNERSLETMQIQPGIRGLNLNILHTTDVNNIEDSIVRIKNSMSREHCVVLNIQKLVVAVLESRVLQQRQQGRSELEEIIEQTPGHLNSLSELELVYRESSRVTEADRCKHMLKEVLESNGIEDIKRQATCLIEQAFVAMIEPTLNFINESYIISRLSDLNQTLIAKHQQSEGEHMNILEECLYHNRQTLRYFRNTPNYQKSDPGVLRNLIVLQKFFKALLILEERGCKIDSPWIFHFAKAFNRYYDSLDNIIKKTPNVQETDIVVEKERNVRKDMKQTTIGALHLFWKVIKDSKSDDSMLAYVARSYAFIGHILINRRHLVDEELEHGDVFSDCQLKMIRDEPFIALDEGCKLLPNDKTILNRYGRAYFNLYYKGNPCNKLMYLLLAEDKLSESIADCDDRNWFALVTRMSVREKMAAEIHKTEAKKVLLAQAKEDGIRCFRTKSTSKDMTILGRICRRIANFHTDDKNDRNHKLVEALDYLYHGIHVGSFNDIDLLTQTASCLLDLQEYEMAVEWQKRAWWLSRMNYTPVFHNIIFYSLTLMKHLKMNSSASSRIKFVMEGLIYILATGKNKSYDLSETYEKLSKHNLELVVIFFKEIEESKIQLSNQEHIVLMEFITFSKNIVSYHYFCEFERIESVLREVSVTKELDHELSVVFLQPTVFPSFTRSSLAFNTKFKYDFFVSCSHKDERWVNHVLLAQLETAFGSDDISFQGCIGRRDFQIGVNITDNIPMAIENSFKVILILTKHFIASNWCKYEKDHAIIRSLNSKKDKNCVIPICLDLDPEDIPRNLQHLTALGLSKDTDSTYEINRIKDMLLLNSSFKDTGENIDK